MEQAQISKLLDKYIAGNCTPEEERAVQHWLDSRPQQGGEWKAMSAAAQQEYLAGLFHDVKQTIGKDEGVQHAGRDDAGVMHMKASRRSWYAGLRIAAVLLVVLGVTLLYLFRGSLMPQQLHTVTTAHRETKRIVLPDSSVVVLNSGSRLSYAEDWKDREVLLEGEAYFEVQASPEHPFVIKSGELRTRVLGTNFNISAYPGDKRISVGVMTGKVELSKLRSGDKLLVTSGEKAVYDRQEDKISREETAEADKVLVASGEVGVYDRQKNRISHEGTKDTLYNAWMEGQLNFYRTPLSDVTAALERTFGIRIRILNSYENECEINGRFHVNQTPADIIKIICISINAECTIEGNEVVIDNDRPCN